MSWLMEYMQNNGPVDILNADFVEAYLAWTEARAIDTNWGARKCPTLSRDLRYLWAIGRARRGRVGLGFNWQPGFPKWVWSYEPLPKEKAPGG